MKGDKTKITNGHPQQKVGKSQEVTSMGGRF